MDQMKINSHSQHKFSNPSLSTHDEITHRIDCPSVKKTPPKRALFGNENG